MNVVLSKVVQIAGGQAELARKCTQDGYKVSQPKIWNWLNRDKKIPAEAVLPLQKAANGKVTCNELRPDLYPVDVVESSLKHETI